ncbi:hypothetical protein [Arcticibacter sp. MXS-1]|uniref:hypothetical protein n=1 Tax=Arcticibacter sp. MXS-1 TaxID=3341726 RepID=UPI0035A8D3AB
MTFKKISSFALFSFVITASPSQAQVWKKIQRSVEDKAGKAVENVINGKKSSASASQTTGASSGDTRRAEEEAYAFVPGTKVIFESDFKRDVKGRMPRRWKSSGAGSITSIADVPGNWLSLAEKTTYKIDSLFNTPGNFTVEFDLLTRSAESADIGSMSFGFARDNSVRNHLTDAYNGNAITNTQLHFHNREITNSSSDTEIYNTLDFPLANYANSLLHVAISVEGEVMSVYLNKSKVLDTRMFKPGAPKYFYLTAPFSYDQQSKVYFGNFVMAALP